MFQHHPTVRGLVVLYCHRCDLTFDAPTVRRQPAHAHAGIVEPLPSDEDTQPTRASWTVAPDG